MAVGAAAAAEQMYDMYEAGEGLARMLQRRLSLQNSYYGPCTRFIAQPSYGCGSPAATYSSSNLAPLDTQSCSLKQTRASSAESTETDKDHGDNPLTA